ncbi:hypothetical protein TPA0906_66670 [Streptomyces olivaceus]|uniref:hypothetical protein n=1 Tax=Streptomyces olivaceus TaxID=47716 RepID=UPI001CCBF10C|nr:hypothetical protein [Streptomyces olivaceus]MBZ6207529.1 hypothetical protein [Streptomyces olivaceus]MBZ6290405.1 hypothetical protein [Streptomyces olivaceus]MBZ6324357.1 hypothetical protein [Streptomyces olivaceus]GHJ04802.1 hypothetical protein TPA0906_66670 [Streptomyces olivaceus]
MSTRYGWDDDVRHHLSQTVPGPQADDMVAALKREYADELATADRETLDRIRRWYELYRPLLPKSAAGDLSQILADHATEK